MAAIRDHRGPLDIRGRKAVAGSLIAALLTSGCAGSAPRLTPPPDFRATDLESCRALAEKTRAGIAGGSVWESMALGASAGSSVARGSALSTSSTSGGDGLVTWVLLGSVVAIGAVAGAGVGIVRGMSTRKAAYDDAMDTCLRPALLTRELGPGHPDVAYSLHALGYRYARLADFAAAEPLYRRALAIQERTLGAEAPEVATILHDYAALLRQTGRAAEAEEMERRAAAIRGNR
jgi:tetratricopeptide (TPR) repeat protein